MNLKKIVIIFFIYILNLNNLHAIEPDVFVQSTVNRASLILSKNSEATDEIIEQVTKKVAI